MDSSQLDKWQQMLVIVKKHSTSQPNFKRQFQKLFLQRFLSETLIVFFLQYTGLTLSTLTAHPMPLWLASGTACAFIFLRGYSVVPGIFAGSFFAYIFAKSGFSLACVCAAIFSLQAILLLFICQRFISPGLIFYRKITFVKFILFTLILTAMTSAALEFICYGDAGTLQLGLQWWLANFNGILVFATALTSLDAYFPQIENLKKLDKRKLGFLYGALLVSITAVLLSHAALFVICFAVATLLLIMLLSGNYAWCGAITAMFILGLAVTIAAFLGAPVFASHFTSASSFFLQIILSLCVIPALMGIKKGSA